MKIFDIAKEEIIIIDNYAGKELLKILSEIKINVIIVSKNIDNILINKYKKEYNNVEFINKETFHDRFIIIDRKTMYSCGASFKDLGKKCFSIHEIDDEKLLKEMITKINS